MENKLENSEKKCPKCKSSNIKYMGASHVVGSGEPMRKPDKFQYECSDCENSFHISKI
jgi:transposase-like protein